MLSGEAFHPLIDVESMQLMEGEVNITLCSFGGRGIWLQFESWQKYWLIQITGTCTNECAAGMEQLNRSTYLKLRGKLRRKKGNWKLRFLINSPRYKCNFYSTSLCCKLKRLCSWGQSHLLSSFPLCSVPDSQMQPLSGSPNESAHFELKI